MNKAHESFSAFLDGEASELDVQRMLKALDDSPNTLNDWHDLSKVQAAMHGDVVVDTAKQFNAEQEDKAPQQTKGFSLRLLQGGIAAAVAVVVVTTANFAMNTGNQQEIATITVPEEVNDIQLGQQQFEAQQRLDVYLREHAEQASFSSGHVVAPAEAEWVEGEQ